MYKEMYLTLFNAITDILPELDPEECAGVRLRLMEAQRRSEEIFLAAEDEREEE